MSMRRTASKLGGSSRASPALFQSKVAMDPPRWRTAIPRQQFAHKGDLNLAVKRNLPQRA